MGADAVLRLIRVFILFLFLSGCTVRSTAVHEYVRDVQPTVTAEDAPYEIFIDPPDDSELLSSNSGRTDYRGPHGDYYIETRCFVTDSMDAALYALSGSTNSGIFMKVDEGEECRLAWCCSDGECHMICRAKIILQGEFCYSLCFQVREGLGKQYNDCINAVFSSFTLQARSSDKAQVFSEDIAV